MAGTYSFGDTPLATRRLGLLADTFARATAAFLLRDGLPRPVLAVDLGSGPGHTSALISETLGAERVVALDSSEAYVREASERLVGVGSARVADVTGPLPELAGAQLAFARFLVTHLADPAAAVAGWLEQLPAGGVLMLEEVEGIDCDEPVLARYLDLQRAMLTARGHELDVGSRLDAIALRLRPDARSSVHRLAVPASTAARMFAMNFDAWRDDPAVPASAEERDALAAALERVVTGELTWRLRQVALTR